MQFGYRMGSFLLGGTSIILAAIFWGAFGSMLSAPNVQRMLMAKEEPRIRAMLLGGAAMTPVLFGLFTIIGMGALAYYPGLQRAAVLPTLLQGFANNGLLRGMFLVGILAVLMSTIDSFLHSASVTVVGDLIYTQQSFEEDNTQHLRAVQLTAILLGLVALYMASTGQQSLYLNYGSWLLFSFFVPPLLGGLMGLETKNKDLWRALLAALVVEAVGLGINWEGRADWWYGHYLHSVWFAAILANLLVYLASHYLRNGAFVCRAQTPADA